MSHAIPDRSLLMLIMAGALGSILGGLLLDTIRGERSTTGWLLLGFLVISYSRMSKHPLTTKGLRHLQTKAAIEQHFSSGKSSS